MTRNGCYGHLLDLLLHLLVDSRRVWNMFATRLERCHCRCRCHRRRHHCHDECFQVDAASHHVRPVQAHRDVRAVRHGTQVLMPVPVPVRVLMVPRDYEMTAAAVVEREHACDDREH